MNVWLFWFLASLAGFVVLETVAVSTGRPTLSRAVWNLSAAFPPFPAIFGMVVGFLVCHFWWYGAYCVN